MPEVELTDAELANVLDAEEVQKEDTIAKAEPQAPQKASDVLKTALAPLAQKAQEARGELVRATRYSNEEIKLITETVAKGASLTELKLFLYQATRTGLDPLARQIYCVKRWNSKLNRDEMAIQTGIDGYRVIADRTGLYAGNDDYEFDDPTNRPKWAKSTIYKIVGGIRCPFTATARWEQYFPGDKQGFMWQKMPHLMLGKCAEALALRKAFPADLSGVYTHEEMEQAGDMVWQNPNAQNTLHNSSSVLANQELKSQKKFQAMPPLQGIRSVKASPNPEPEKPKAESKPESVQAAPVTDELPAEQLKPRAKKPPVEPVEAKPSPAESIPQPPATTADMVQDLQIRMFFVLCRKPKCKLIEGDNAAGAQGWLAEQLGWDADKMRQASEGKKSSEVVVKMLRSVSMGDWREKLLPNLRKQYGI